MALAIARNAGSDASDGSSSDDVAKTAESSPAPSLESSFERLNILDSSDHSEQLQSYYTFDQNEIQDPLKAKLTMTLYLQCHPYHLYHRLPLLQCHRHPAL